MASDWRGLGTWTKLALPGPLGRAAREAAVRGPAPMEVPCGLGAGRDRFPSWSGAFRVCKSCSTSLPRSVERDLDISVHRDLDKSGGAGDGAAAAGVSSTPPWPVDDESQLGTLPGDANSEHPQPVVIPLFHAAGPLPAAACAPSLRPTGSARCQVCALRCCTSRTVQTEEDRGVGPAAGASQRPREAPVLGSEQRRRRSSTEVTIRVPHGITLSICVAQTPSVADARVHGASGRALTAAAESSGDRSENKAEHCGRGSSAGATTPLPALQVRHEHAAGGSHRRPTS